MLQAHTLLPTPLILTQLMLPSDVPYFPQIWEMPQWGQALCHQLGAQGTWSKGQCLEHKGKLCSGLRLALSGGTTWSLCQTGPLPLHCGCWQHKQDLMPQ